MEIKGIWLNSTTESITVTVNGENYSGIIDAGGHSPIMSMTFTSLMALSVNIATRTDLNSIVLLWQTQDLAHPEILQQAERFGSWSPVAVDRSMAFGIYRFIIEESDGGLLIVGTVELVENGVFA